MERELKKLGLSIAAIHSDLEQQERENVLLKFRNRDLKVLVATDVLSRGIDIENISMVVNYDVPADGEDYIHRVGRTARAETKGEAVTFVSPDDMRKFGSIERLIGYEVEKGVVHEALGAAPTYNGGAPRSGGGKKKFFNRRKKSGGGNKKHTAHKPK